MTRRALTLAVLALAAVLTAGCGSYHDRNREAVRVVAQSYLDGYHERDGAQVCVAIAPVQRDLVGSHSGGDCVATVRGQAPRGDRSRRVAKVTIDLLHSPPVATADVPGFGLVGLQKYGATWYVVSSPRIS